MAQTRMFARGTRLAVAAALLAAAAALRRRARKRRRRADPPPARRSACSGTTRSGRPCCRRGRTRSRSSAGSAAPTPRRTSPLPRGLRRQLPTTGPWCRAGEGRPCSPTDGKRRFAVARQGKGGGSQPSQSAARHPLPRHLPGPPQRQHRAAEVPDGQLPALHPVPVAGLLREGLEAVHEVPRPARRQPARQVAHQGRRPRSSSGTTAHGATASGSTPAHSGHGRFKG